MLLSIRDVLFAQADCGVSSLLLNEQLMGFKMKEFHDGMLIVDRGDTMDLINPLEKKRDILDDVQAEHEAGEDQEEGEGGHHHHHHHHHKHKGEGGNDEQLKRDKSLPRLQVALPAPSLSGAPSAMGGMCSIGGLLQGVGELLLNLTITGGKDNASAGSNRRNGSTPDSPKRRPSSANTTSARTARKAVGDSAKREATEFLEYSQLGPELARTVAIAGAVLEFSPEAGTAFAHATGRRRSLGLGTATEAQVQEERFQSFVRQFVSKDTDGDGQITRAEQEAIFVQEGVDVSNAAVKDFIDKELAHLDADGSTAITMSEFMKAAGFGERWEQEDLVALGYTQQQEPGQNGCAKQVSGEAPARSRASEVAMASSKILTSKSEWSSTQVELFQELEGHVASPQIKGLSAASMESLTTDPGLPWAPFFGWSHMCLPDGVVVDSRGEFWLTDLSSASKEHCLTDLAHLEASMLLEMCPLPLTLAEVRNATPRQLASWLVLPREDHNLLLRMIGADETAAEKARESAVEDEDEGAINMAKEGGEHKKKAKKHDDPFEGHLTASQWYHPANKPKPAARAGKQGHDEHHHGKHDKHDKNDKHGKHGKHGNNKKEHGHHGHHSPKHKKEKKEKKGCTLGLFSWQARDRLAWRVLPKASACEAQLDEASQLYRLLLPCVDFAYDAEQIDLSSFGSDNVDDSDDDESRRESRISSKSSISSQPPLAAANPGALAAAHAAAAALEAAAVIEEMAEEAYAAAMHTRPPKLSSWSRITARASGIRGTIKIGKSEEKNTIERQDLRHSPDPTAAGCRVKTPQLLLWWGCLCQLRRLGRRFMLALTNGRDPRNPHTMYNYSQSSAGAAASAANAQDTRHPTLTAQEHALDAHMLGLAVPVLKKLLQAIAEDRRLEDEWQKRRRRREDAEAAAEAAAQAKERAMEEKRYEAEVERAAKHGLPPPVPPPMVPPPSMTTKQLKDRGAKGRKGSVIAAKEAFEMEAVNDHEPVRLLTSWQRAFAMQAVLRLSEYLSVTLQHPTGKPSPADNWKGGKRKVKSKATEEQKGFIQRMGAGGEALPKPKPKPVQEPPPPLPAPPPVRPKGKLPPEVLSWECGRYRRFVMRQCWWGGRRDPVSGQRMPLVTAATFELKRLSPSDKARIVFGENSGCAHEDLDLTQDVAIFDQRQQSLNPPSKAGSLPSKTVADALRFNRLGLADRGLGAMSSSAQGEPLPPQAVVVVGETSSGKSMLIRRVALDIMQRESGLDFPKLDKVISAAQSEEEQLEAMTRGIGGTIPIILHGSEVIAALLSHARVNVAAWQAEQQKGAGGGRRASGRRRASMGLASKTGLAAANELLDVVLRYKFGAEGKGRPGKKELVSMPPPPAMDQKPPVPKVVKTKKGKGKSKEGSTEEGVAKDGDSIKEGGTAKEGEATKEGEAAKNSAGGRRASAAKKVAPQVQLSDTEKADKKATELWEMYDGVDTRLEMLRLAVAQKRAVIMIDGLDEATIRDPTMPDGVECYKWRPKWAPSEADYTQPPEDTRHMEFAIVEQMLGLKDGVLTKLIKQPVKVKKSSAPEEEEEKKDTEKEKEGSGSGAGGDGAGAEDGKGKVVVLTGQAANKTDAGGVTVGGDSKAEEPKPADKPSQKYGDEPDAPLMSEDRKLSMALASLYGDGNMQLPKPPLQDSENHNMSVRLMVALEQMLVKPLMQGGHRVMVTRRHLGLDSATYKRCWVLRLLPLTLTKRVAAFEYVTTDGPSAARDRTAFKFLHTHEIDGAVKMLDEAPTKMNEFGVVEAAKEAKMDEFGTMIGGEGDDEDDGPAHARAVEKKKSTAYTEELERVTNSRERGVLEYVRNMIVGTTDMKLASRQPAHDYEETVEHVTRRLKDLLSIEQYREFTVNPLSATLLASLFRQTALADTTRILREVAGNKTDPSAIWGPLANGMPTTLVAVYREAIDRAIMHFNPIFMSVYSSNEEDENAAPDPYEDEDEETGEAAPKKLEARLILQHIACQAQEEGLREYTGGDVVRWLTQGELLTKWEKAAEEKPEEDESTQFAEKREKRVKEAKTEALRLRKLQNATLQRGRAGRNLRVWAQIVMASRAGIFPVLSIVEAGVEFGVDVVTAARLRVREAGQGAGGGKSVKVIDQARLMRKFPLEGVGDDGFVSEYDVIGDSLRKKPPAKLPPGGTTTLLVPVAGGGASPAGGREEPATMHPLTRFKFVQLGAQEYLATCELTDSIRRANWEIVKEQGRRGGGESGRNAKVGGLLSLYGVLSCPLFSSPRLPLTYSWHTFMPP
jgi:hypothetical protein